METFLIKAAQLILSLSILVVLHEGGHFFFAKLFKIRVEKFYLFFDPWFHLFKFKPKNSDTEYGIGWLPFGGYVKIAGMIDESMDKEQMQQPEQPWEFRSKPAYQRLLVMIGGVLVNFLLAIFIYSMVLYTWGDSYFNVRDMKMGMVYNQTAKEIGFRDGDMPVKTDAGEIGRFGTDFYRAVAKAKVVTVMRNGKEVDIEMPAEKISLITMLKEEPPFMKQFIPNEIDTVIAGTPIAKAGVKTGDKLVALNGKPINSYNAFENEMMHIKDMAVKCSHADSLKLRNVVLVTQRGAQLDTLNIMLGEDFLFGFSPKFLDDYTPMKTDQFSFFESFPAGISYGMRNLKGYVSDLRYVFSAEGAKSVGSFGAMGSMFAPTWNWHIFWLNTALLSIILAFMNILPIPALDGGHVLFLLYEIITRRKPSEKFLERAQMVGMCLLLALMILALGNDFLRGIGLSW